MSYTTFEYANLILNEEVASDGRISCEVTNTGSRDGEEVSQVYVIDMLASIVRPYMEFAGCKWVALKAEEKKTLRFSMRADQFSFLDADNRWVVEAGEMRVTVGASSKDIRLNRTFTITNTGYIDPQRRGFYADVQVP